MTIVEVIALIVVVLALIGAAYNLLEWAGVFEERRVSNLFFVCPYCLLNVEPGDRIGEGPQGDGHLRCLKWRNR